MIEFFKTIIYLPLFNLLIFIYEQLPYRDLGIAIILLTIIIRIVLFPFFYKSARDQAILQKLNPKIKEIREKYKNDLEKQGRLMMALYREHKVNPFSIFFIMLFVQLPILISLYYLFLKGITPESLKSLYSFVPKPAEVNHFFIGLFDLTKTSLSLAALAAIAQYWQGKLSFAGANTSQGQTEIEKAVQDMSKMFVYVGPILTFVFLGFILPSAVALYWLTTSLFSVIQQIIINKKMDKLDYGGKGKIKN